MVRVQITLHVINLMLFLLAALTYAQVMVRIWQIPHFVNKRSTDVITSYNAFRLMGHVLCLVGMLLCLVFVALQADWIINNHNEAVGDLTSMMWLLWDYLAVLFFLVNAAIGHVLVEWRGGTPFAQDARWPCEGSR